LLAQHRLNDGSKGCAIVVAARHERQCSYSCGSRPDRQRVGLEVRCVHAIAWEEDPDASCVSASRYVCIL
jgi:hypothetical protein